MYPHLDYCDVIYHIPATANQYYLIYNLASSNGIY